jgi:hypothetical protein
MLKRTTSKRYRRFQVEDVAPSSRLSLILVRRTWRTDLRRLGGKSADNYRLRGMSRTLSGRRRGRSSRKPKPDRRSGREQEGKKSLPPSGKPATVALGVFLGASLGWRPGAGWPVLAARSIGGSLLSLPGWTVTATLALRCRGDSIAEPSLSLPGCSGTASAGH